MVPAVQLVHVAAPAALLLPAVQAMQVVTDVAPTASLNKPAAQGVEGAPAAHQEPGLQVTQAAMLALAFRLDVPAAQGRQAVLLFAPVVGPYVPAAQGVRLKDAQKKPRGHKGKVISRMRLFLASATYTLPAALMAKPDGPCINE